eukprot:scaffold2668_cov319-Prasinococcus_capsulatus_cf.AAC.14
MLSDATRAAGSSIKTVPIAGKDLTLFVHKLLRERGVAVPAEDLYAAAQVVKEQHCYTCSDVSKEPAKFDRSGRDHCCNARLMCTTCNPMAFAHAAAVGGVETL